MLRSLMSLEIVRRIRDNTHGTIDISALEDAVLNHEYVQRLRRIRQLAFLYLVFPGASHSRFEHSLGVMNMAGTAWAKLEANQRRLADSLQKYDDFAGLENRRGKIFHPISIGMERERNEGLKSVCLILERA